SLPVDRVVLVQGRLPRFDLAAGVIALQRLRRDAIPDVHVSLDADRMSVAGAVYEKVSLQSERTRHALALQIESAGIRGSARLPAASRGDVARLSLDRFDVPEGAFGSEAAGLVASIAPLGLLSVGDLRWRGHSLGRFSATVSAQHSLTLE